MNKTTQKQVEQYVDEYLQKKGVLTPASALPPHGFSRAKDLLQYLPFGLTKLWELARDPNSNFPRPIRMGGNMTCFANEDVHDYFEYLKQQREIV